MEKEFEKRSTTKAVQSIFLKIHPDDNVLVALKDLVHGTKVLSNGSSFELRENVAAKHKFFEHDMHTGDDVIMYGVLVGRLQSDVFKGQAMTTTNTKHAAGKYSYRSFQYNWQAPDTSRFLHKTFNGFKRSDGRVGTGTLMLSGKRCGMNWVMLLPTGINALPAKCYRHIWRVMILITLI